MKIITVTLTHNGRITKVTEPGTNALDAIDKMSRAGYDLNTATAITIKNDAGVKEYA